MRAGRLQALGIISKVILLTFWITLLTVYEAYTGRYQRERVDRRLRWWSLRLLKCVDLSYEVIAPHDFRFQKNRSYIIMTNHSSLYDIPLIFMALPGSIRMLTKKELFRVPLWGRGLLAGEFISIDRHNRRQAFRDLEEARRKMESGIILWIAPEGTRSRTAEIGPFKKGGFMLAFKTGATILPVGIRGAMDVLPPKTSEFQLGKRVEIHIGKPVDVLQFNRKNSDQLMETVRRELSRLTGLPVAG
jgi:1-acyl-sn-glycerol-3-phosphate acyltransferase